MFSLLFGYTILFNSIELKLEKERSEVLQQEVQDLNNQLRAEREQLLNTNSEKATLAANFNNIQERLVEQKKEVAELQNQFSIQFDSCMRTSL